MLCTACAQDREPIIEGDQSGRFVYTCGNAACHANLGPVQREGRPAPPPAPPLMAAPPAPAMAPMLAVPPALVNRSAMSVAELGASYAESIRQQIAVLDAEIAKADALRVERDMLRRMLAAAERTAKRRRRTDSAEPMLLKGTVVPAVLRDRLT